MSASGSCRASCTRSLYEDLLCKVSVSRSPQLDYLCRISVCGSLVQDLSGMMSASGSSRTSCARSLYGDLLRKISLSGCLHQDSVGPLAQDLCMKSEIATLPAFRAMDARSPQRVALRNPKPQFHLHSAHLTRTISADGCTLKSKNTISLAFRALDTHDLRRGFTFRNHASEVLHLPRNHEPRSYEMLHWPRKRILKLKLQKCNPSQELSPLTSKYKIHGADSLHLPRKTQSFEWHTPAKVLATSTKYCACHDFHNVSDSLHLPCKLTFLTSISDRFLAPAMQNEDLVRKRTRTPGKTTPSKLRKSRRQLCASLRSRNQHRISKRHSCTDETTKRVP